MAFFVDTLQCSVPRPGSIAGAAVAAAKRTAKMQCMVRMLRSIPILRIFDEAKAREFYVSFLGFAIDWEHRFAPDAPLYMQVSRIRIDTQDLDAFHAELTAKQYKYARLGINEQPWGREVSVKDPFGNRLIFAESE